MSDDVRFTVQTANTWSIKSLAKVADLLRQMPVNSTAMVRVAGEKNENPAGLCTVAHVLDGWVVHCAASPEPSWVGTLRQLLEPDNAYSALFDPQHPQEGGTPDE